MAFKHEHNNVQHTKDKPIGLVEDICLKEQEANQNDFQLLVEEFQFASFFKVEWWHEMINLLFILVPSIVCEAVSDEVCSSLRVKTSRCLFSLQ